MIETFINIGRWVRDQFQWVAKVASYAWFLRKDRDWDYGHLLSFMRFKLIRMEKCIRENKIVEANMRISKQIRYACFLIEELEKGPSGQLTELNDNFRKKWGDPEIDFEPTEDEQFTQIKVNYPNVRSAKDRADCDEEQRELRLEQHRQYEDRKHRLFRHLDRYLTRWWD